MATRITGNDTPLVSVRQEDLDKFNAWLKKLGASPVSPVRPYSAPTPTKAPIKPVKATKKAVKKGAKAGATAATTAFGILAGWASNPALSGQPQRPRTPEERRKYLDSLTRK